MHPHAVVTNGDQPGGFFSPVISFCLSMTRVVLISGSSADQDPMTGAQKQAGALFIRINGPLPSCLRQTWKRPSGEGRASACSTTVPSCNCQPPLMSLTSLIGTGKQSFSEQHSMGYQLCAKAGTIMITSAVKGLHTILPSIIRQKGAVLREASSRRVLRCVECQLSGASYVSRRHSGGGDWTPMQQDGRS